MADKLLSSMKQKITAFELQPSQGGCFEITVNDELVYSKLETGSFPDEAEIVAAVEKLS